MQFELKRTITHVSMLSALLPALSVLAADEGAGGKLDPASAPGRGQYVYDSLGVNVRSAVTRGCVSTGFWTPQTATPECHPDLFASPAQAMPKAAAAPVAEPTPLADNRSEYVPQEPIPAEAAAEEAPVEEFVQEAEPADMAPMTAAEGAEAEDTTIGGPVMFGDNDEESAAKDEGETRSYEEDSAVQDDGIIGHNVYNDDEESVAKDEDIVGGTVFNDDDEGVSKDDGIVGSNVYNDDEDAEAKDEDITAESVYSDDDSGKEPEQLISEPKAIVEEETAKEEPAPEPEQQAAPAELAAAPTEPTPAPAEEPAQAAAPAEEQAAAPVEQQAAAPVEQQAAAPVEQQAAAPVEQQAAAPVEQQAAAPVEQQAEQPTAQVEQQQPAQAEAPAQAVTMLPVTITVEADPLFDFDKHSIRADSSKKLDDLVTQLKGVTYGDILCVGFADPIGSSMYNQTLSKRRAIAVKQYLVAKGVPAGSVKADGRGETQEFASFESCGGMRKQKLISCLQPDRRVEVTVTAEKQK